MRNACSAFSTVIDIQRAGKAREGRQILRPPSARSRSTSQSASISDSSRLISTSEGGGVSA